MPHITIGIQGTNPVALFQTQSIIPLYMSHLYGIHNYFKHKLTNAGSEGFNNKINVIKRAAYGFQDIEYFKLKILQQCGGM
jgi:transposase